MRSPAGAGQFPRTCRSRCHSTPNMSYCFYTQAQSVEGKRALARETITKLIDDIDGSVAAETVTFGLDGHQYQIDLSAKNAKKLRTELAPYLERGHRVTGRTVAPGRGRRGRATA